MPTAQMAPGRLLRPADDPPPPPDPGLPSGLWLAQEGELPEDLWPTEEPDPAEGDTAGPVVLKAGRWDRARGDGGGFAAGGVADDLPPGPVLAGFAADAWTA